jgi:hypothetical protein
MVFLTYTFGLLNFILFTIVFIAEINNRLERRTNTEWKRMKRCKNLAAAAAAAATDAIVEVVMVSPIKSKRGPDKKQRARRIKGGDLTELESSSAFARASGALNFADDGNVCSFFDISIIFLCVTEDEPATSQTVSSQSFISAVDTSTVHLIPDQQMSAIGNRRQRTSGHRKLLKCCLYRLCCHCISLRMMDDVDRLEVGVFVLSACLLCA